MTVARPRGHLDDRLVDRARQPLRQSAEAAALAATTLGFPEDQRGQIAVPHLVGKTQVGTILGFYVLKVASNTPDNARAEAAMAFPLGQGVFAIGAVHAAQAAERRLPRRGRRRSDRLEPRPGVHRAAGVRLEGNFPPTIVSIRAERGTRTVRGKVVDAFRHAVVGAQVSLERRVGSSWRRVARRGPTGMASTRSRAPAAAGIA